MAAHISTGVVFLQHALHLDNTTITDTALERLKNAKSVLYFRQLPCHLLQNNDKSTQS